MLFIPTLLNICFLSNSKHNIGQIPFMCHIENDTKNQTKAINYSKSTYLLEEETQTATNSWPVKNREKEKNIKWKSK